MFRVFNPVLRLLCLLCLCGISGCAGLQAWNHAQGLLQKGEWEAGLAQLEQAVRLAPAHPGYRAQLYLQRERVAQIWLEQAVTAQKQGQYEVAAQLYTRVLNLQAAQPQAQQGLLDVQRARRLQQDLQMAQTWFERGVKESKPGALFQARDRLRPILQEDPHFAPALLLQERVQAALAAYPDAEQRIALALRKPLTLQEQQSPLRSVLARIGQSCGLQFQYDHDLPPDLRVSLFVKDQEAGQVLRHLLRANQLEQQVLGPQNILIFARNDAKLREYQQLRVHTFHLAYADVKNTANTLKTLLKLKDLSFDERLSAISVRDDAAAIQAVEQLIAQLDVPEAELMLDVEILQIQRQRLLEFGVQWPSRITLSPLTGASEALTLAWLRNIRSQFIPREDLRLTLKAGVQSSDVNLLAHSKIRIRHKDKARLHIGDRVPVISSTSSATGFAADSISYLDVGLKLEAEAQVYGNQEIGLKLLVDMSSLVREVISQSGTQSYQISARNLNTNLRLQHGQTAVLAGLLSREQRHTAAAVPGLGEFPVLSRLFGSGREDAQETEILLLVTPHLLRPWGQTKGVEFVADQANP